MYFLAQQQGCTFPAFFIFRKMREKLTHFSRENARNARKDLYCKTTTFQPKYWPYFFQNIVNCKSNKNLVVIRRINVVEQFLCKRNKFPFENVSNLGQIGLKMGQNWSIFPAISRGRISREKCLAKPFLVLARNARNVHL